MGDFFIITTQIFAYFFMTAQKQANDITPNKVQNNNSSNTITGEIERHPFEPFLPKNAKLYDSYTQLRDHQTEFAIE